uniref:Craniofacial development protein 2 n=1 Tax=Cacopsylla melanoneura TaxID=428564 RepID=A0A8D9DR12_9HEMI
MEKHTQRSNTLSGSRNPIDPETDVTSGPTCRIPGASEVRNKQDTTSSGAQTSIERLRSMTWNIGSLTGKSKELAEVMRRRNIDIACLQETKWKNTDENKCRYLEPDKEEFKLYYYGKNTNRNGVGIVIHEKFHNNVIKITGVSDRILQVKVVIYGKIYNILSVYAPQIGCDNEEKEQFYETLEDVLERIPENELVMIGSDMNGHVGKNRDGHEECHGGYGFGEKNEPGERVVNLAEAYDLKIVNTFYKKKDEHLITFKSGPNKTQIDYWICSRDLASTFKDCKVIPGEALTSQHRLLLLEILLIQFKEKKDTIKPVGKIKWFKISKEDGKTFVNTMNQWFHGELEEAQEINTNEMWNKLEKHCLKTATEMLGVSKGKLRTNKECWWWNETVKTVIKNKKDAFKRWNTCTDETEKDRLKSEYKEAKKLAKQEVARAQDQGTETFYQDLCENKQEGSQKLYKLAAQRREKSKSIRNPKYINGTDGTLKIKEKDICDRWKEYYSNLLNEEFPRKDHVPEQERYGPIQEITECEVNIAVKSMKKNKAVGPDAIPSELWKSCNEAGIEWLRLLMNKIIIWVTCYQIV